MPTPPGSRHERISGESQRPLLTFPCRDGRSELRSRERVPFNVASDPVSPPHQDSGFGPPCVGQGEPADTRRGGAGEPPALGSLLSPQVQP